MGSNFRPGGKVEEARMGELLQDHEYSGRGGEKETPSEEKGKM